MEQLVDPFLLAIFWICVLIPCGIFLRNRFTLFQKYLVPSCLIAGFIGMILMNLTKFFYLCLAYCNSIYA